MEFPAVERKGGVNIMEEEKEIGDTEGKFVSLEEKLDVKEVGEILREVGKQVNEQKSKGKRGRPPKKDKQKKGVESEMERMDFSEGDVVMEGHINKEESEEKEGSLKKSNNLGKRGRKKNDLIGKEEEIDSEREGEEKEKGDSDEVTCGKGGRKKNDMNENVEEEKEKMESDEVTGRTRKSRQIAMEKLKGISRQMAEWDEEERNTGRKRRGQGPKRGMKTEENGESEKIGSKKRGRKRSKDAVENGGDSAVEGSRKQEGSESKKHKDEREEKVEGSESRRYHTRQGDGVQVNPSNPRNRKRKDENVKDLNVLNASFENLII